MTSHNGSEPTLPIFPSPASAILHRSITEFRSPCLLTEDRVLYNREEVLHKLLSGNSTHFSGDTSIVDEIGRVIDTERKADLDEIRDIAQTAVRNARKRPKSESQGTSVAPTDAARKLDEALCPPLVRASHNGTTPASSNYS